MPADVTVTIPGWVLVVGTVLLYVWVLAGTAVTLENVWHHRHELLGRGANLIMLPVVVVLGVVVVWPWLLHERVLEFRAARSVGRQEYPW